MISSFITITDPIERADPFLQCIESASGFSDEIVVVDGSKYPRMRPGMHEVGDKWAIQVNSHWPREFKWDLIGNKFQEGYEAATQQWVFHLDADFIFHERDYVGIIQALKGFPNTPAISFYKWQFILPDRYNLKSRLILAVNKGVYGDRIRFNGGGDLCQPTLNGVDLDLDKMPQSGIPFYNYEHILKTKDQIVDDIERMDRAYHRHFGKWLYSNNGNNAYAGWYEMVAGRFQKPSKGIRLDEHPFVMQDTIRSLRPDQFGYSGFGLIEGRVYA